MQTQGTTVPRKPKSPKALSFAGYRHVDAMFRPDRTAHALDWAATRHPKHLVAYNILLRAVMGYDRTPRINSNEVEALRGCMSRVRAILAEKYDRGLVVEAGVGVRATADTEDAMKTDLVAQARRKASADKSFARSAGMVAENMAKIPATQQNAPWLKWLKTVVKPALAEISAPDYVKRLLPPGDDRAKAAAPVKKPDKK